MRKINKLYISVILFCVFVINISVFAQDSQKDELFFEGPNIFYGKDSLIIKYAIDSSAYTHKLEMAEYTHFNGFHRDSNQTYFIPEKFKQDCDNFVLATNHANAEINKC